MLRIVRALAALALVGASAGPSSRLRPPRPLDLDVPTFDSPDRDINDTWNYRWQLVSRHLTYGSPATGYVFTEFLDHPFWSGAYGAISCPLGHQLYETRWLRDRRYAQDFARYWFETPGAQPRSYSNWYGDAVWATYLVTGDSAFLHAMLPHMIAQYEGWMAEHWDAGHRMFHWDGMHDGMEVNINSRQTSDTESGGEGYRPTLNSYLFADARAIARTAVLFGDTARAREFGQRAADLKQRVQQELWDPRRKFFLHQFAHDEANGVRALTRTYESGPFAGNAHGREEIGFVPWQFELPDSGYETAWRFLMDTTYFLAPYGPTTVERHDPQFLVSPRCCVWSGNAWPYATSQTLTAMANLLHDYRQDVVTPADYVRLLKLFTLDQRKDGRPYIAEAANPFTGSWSGHDTYDHSEHYFHSSYIDLVITGLVGLRPRADDTLEVDPLVPPSWDWFALRDVAYHGRTVSIAWDRTGAHYGHGAGFTLSVDGRTIARSRTLSRLRADLGAARPLPPVGRSVNLAVNNDGAAFPFVRASWSAPESSPHFLNDGTSWYDRSPPDRWTAIGSPNDADTLELRFGTGRPVDRVALGVLDDGDSVRAPATIRLEYQLAGRWAPVPGQRRDFRAPEGGRANRIRFPRIVTPALRVILVHRTGAKSGLTELEAWADSVPLPLAEPTESPPNVAWHAQATASHSGPGDDPAQAVDGRIAYSLYSRDRWSARGSRDSVDWLAVDLGTPRRIGRVEVHFVADGRGLAAPRIFTVEAWTAQGWAPVEVQRRMPERPAASAANTLWIAPVTTSGVRVVVTHARPAVTAITELLLWNEEP